MLLLFSSAYMLKEPIWPLSLYGALQQWLSSTLFREKNAWGAIARVENIFSFINSPWLQLDATHQSVGFFYVLTTHVNSPSPVVSSVTLATTNFSLQRVPSLITARSDIQYPFLIHKEPDTAVAHIRFCFN